MAVQLESPHEQLADEVARAYQLYAADGVEMHRLIAAGQQDQVVAMNTGGMSTPTGYNEEQDYSWARASAFMGAKLLQNAGVVVITSDGSAYA